MILLFAWWVLGHKHLNKVAILDWSVHDISRAGELVFDLRDRLSYSVCRLILDRPLLVLYDDGVRSRDLSLCHTVGQDSDGVQICTKVRSHGLWWISEKYVDQISTLGAVAMLIVFVWTTWSIHYPTQLSRYLLPFLFTHSSSVEIDRVL